MDDSKKAMRSATGNVAEMRSMVGNSEESAILEEFHCYYLCVSVFVDWSHSGEVFALCITQDLLLFLFIYLPISWVGVLFSLFRPPFVAVS